MPELQINSNFSISEQQLNETWSSSCKLYYLNCIVYSITVESSQQQPCWRGSWRKLSLPGPPGFRRRARPSSSSRTSYLEKVYEWFGYYNNDDDDDKKNNNNNNNNYSNNNNYNNNNNNNNNNKNNLKQNNCYQPPFKHYLKT